MILYLAHSIAKCFPIFIIILLLVLMLITNNNIFFILFILSLICDIFNKFLKEIIFRNIYKNRKNIKYLGIGKRPKQAKNCSCLGFLKEEKLFGMPSGHSQYASFFSTFLILLLIYKLDFSEKINYIIFILSVIILILITFYIMYTRVYITNCHTLNQVTVGFIIGCLFAIISFYIVKKYID